MFEIFRTRIQRQIVSDTFVARTIFPKPDENFAFLHLESQTRFIDGKKQRRVRFYVITFMVDTLAKKRKSEFLRGDTLALIKDNAIIRSREH